MQSNKEDNPNRDGSLAYMEELSKAYEEAFAKRLTVKRNRLPEEKRNAIGEMQAEISRIAGKIALLSTVDEKKELARMVKESAEETLRAIEYEAEPAFTADPTTPTPPALLLARATLLSNRCLNLTVRHTDFDAKVAFLLLSELSALYAFAAIN